MTNARVGIALMILPGLVAALWFTNKRRQPEFQKVTLPGEFGTVSVPACFTVEFEDDTTLLAYPKDTDHIAIRFSSISFAKVNEDEFVGKSFVRRNATENGYRFSEIGENGIATFEEDSLEDGVPMLIKYWEVGSKNTIVVISATILQARRNSSAAVGCARRSMIDRWVGRVWRPAHNRDPPTTGNGARSGARGSGS